MALFWGHELPPRTATLRPARHTPLPSRPSPSQVCGSKDVEPAPLATCVVLDQVMVAARRAAVQVERDPAVTAAGREIKVMQLASELNALYSIEQLLCSPIIREAVRSHGLELHAGVLHSRTGEVEFIGRHPMEAAFLSEKLQPQQYERLLKRARTRI